MPIITHLHGGHTDWPWDGNPEFFYTYNDRVKGPQWRNVPGGFTNKFTYDNDIFAGNLWYHDHALGITRLNVYAGLAGFYFVRDEYDTGEPGNPLNLPAWPYEKAYAIQDRMFYDDGRLFYPAFPGDPYYDGFITGEGAVLPEEIFPGGGPTALAEFFGDHMVVNGKIWPKEEVEPRYYRMHLLNGTDSRFMAIQFVQVPLNVTDFSSQIGGPLQFHVIGSDQGLGDEIKNVNMLLLEPGSRYDIIFNFRNRSGQRIIMKNIGGDQPFGGDLVTDDLSLQVFECTDRIMAFDVNKPLHHFTAVADLPNQDLVRPTNNEIDFGPRIEDLGNHRTRKVALFEGTDEFGRLQPLLGTAEPATDYEDQPINWPDEEPYISAGLIGQMEGSIAWHSPTTENPALYSTETWEIYNATGDAHPIHLHLVHFKVLNRQDVILATEDQAVVQHNGAIGNGSKITNIELQGNPITTPPDGYVENTPKDMVTALPGQVNSHLGDVR
ncbi:MAG: multicopper oxidase domain-containing protein [Desulfobacterales bacterium]